MLGKWVYNWPGHSCRPLGLILALVQSNCNWPVVRDLSNSSWIIGAISVLNFLSTVGLLKSLIKQGLLEPQFYGELLSQFKKSVGRNDFSDQFRKIIIRYKRIGYNMNVMRQTACLVVNPITVNNFADLFNCTPWVGPQTKWWLRHKTFS